MTTGLTFLLHISAKVFSPSPIDDDNAMGCEVVPFDALRGIDVWKLSGKV